ncbi:MAG: hypothetical protein IPI67_00480 [Myxococcales bacterium]|nr:hypothetical protein [Myxococcales bacterium]
MTRRVLAAVALGFLSCAVDDDGVSAADAGSEGGGQDACAGNLCMDAAIFDVQLDSGGELPPGKFYCTVDPSDPFECFAGTVCCEAKSQCYDAPPAAASGGQRAHRLVHAPRRADERG